MIKNLNKYIKQATVLSIIILFGTFSAYSQIRKPFEPRVSTQAPGEYQGVTNYNLQGDFKMIGNTNLTTVSAPGTVESNSIVMRYVDVDNDESTINSSSSTLVLDNPDCSEIIYAGLYWTGRAHDISAVEIESSPNTFSVERYSNAQWYHVSHNESFDGTNSMTISRQGPGQNNYYPRYSFDLNGTTVDFEFRNSNILENPRVRYRINNGDWTNIGNQGSFNNPGTNGGTVSGNQWLFSLYTPIVVGDVEFHQLVRYTPDNETEQDYQAATHNAAKVRIRSGSTTTKNLNKQEIKLKMGATNSYTNIVATSTDIHYPTTTDLAMYVAYADVTNYVRNNGAGEYFVADVALQEGFGGPTGLYGGWGMVIIYKDESKPWRDITVFDGFGYIIQNGDPVNLDVSGFRATQNGAVNVTLGVMAGEGDRDNSGDFFQIRNLSDNSSFTTLSHEANTATDFFNSSILTGGNPRNPNYTNNTGLDISRFDINNSGNSIIGNNQTNTRFRFGTDGDTYSIFNIVFAVDAYVPEVIAENGPVTGSPIEHQGEVTPGQEMEFQLDLFNKGTEAVNELTIDIPLPFNVHYVQGGETIIPGSHNTIKIPNNTTVEWIPPAHAPLDASPDEYAGGTLRWNVGTLALDPDREVLQGSLKYKLQVTENCAFLISSAPCGLQIAINGNISGTGASSGTAVSGKLVQAGEVSSCGGGLVFDDFEATILVSNDFIQNCQPPVIENGMLQFVSLCSKPNSVFTRSEIVDLYPKGTKFYSQQPLNYDTNEGLITGDFPVSLDGTKTTYWAMVPGMKAGCFLQLQTSVTNENCPAPGGVSTGLLMWHKADDGINTTPGATAQWNDINGSRHVTQTTATRQPILHTDAYYSADSKNYFFNFNPFYHFNGTNQFFERSGILGDYFSDATKAGSVYGVMYNSNATGWRTPYGWGDDDPNLVKIGEQYQLWRDNGNALETGNIGLNNTPAHIGSMIWKGTETVNNGIYLNFNGRVFEHTSRNIGSINDALFRIGSEGFGSGGNEHYQGGIAEVFAYDVDHQNNFSENEKLRINSYLAIKYGITLKNEAGTETSDYLASNSTNVWNATDNSDYNNNVFGIAKDEISLLNQKQSRSANTSQKLIIGHRDGLSDTNVSNTNDLTNGQFLMVGDNGLKQSLTVPFVYTAGTNGETNFRFESVWKAQNTNGVGTVTVAWPKGVKNLYLLQSADENFGSGNTLTPMTIEVTINGVVYNTTTAILADGEFFTFAGFGNAPGGVTNGLSYWYRADMDVENTGEDTDVTGWADMWGGTTVAQLGDNRLPTYKQGAVDYFNFNAGIHFSGNSNFTNGQTLGNNTVRTLTSLDYDVFTFTKGGITSGGSNSRLFSIGMDNTTTGITNWDAFGIWSGNSNLERRVYGGSTSFPGISPSFATDWSIMYFRNTDVSSAKGLNGEALGTPGTYSAQGYQYGGHIFGNTRFSSNGSDNAGFNGDIGETIVYGAGTLTDVERRRVDSYLAIKYGVTLGRVDTEHYLDADENTVWDGTADEDYNHNIFGVAREDIGLFEQKVSKSVNPGSILTIATINDFVNPNQDATRTGFANDHTYFLLGDNDITDTDTEDIEIEGVNYKRIQRIWLSQRQGTPGELYFQADLLAYGANFSLLNDVVMIIADDEDFTVNVRAISGVNEIGKWIHNYNFNSDAPHQYITYGVKEEQCLPEFVWSSPVSASGNTATGTIDGIGYTYTSSEPVLTSTAIFDNYNVFPDSTGSTDIFSFPRTGHSVIRNIAVTNNSITFDEPVTDPVLVFSSIGGPGGAVPVVFGQPIEVLWMDSRSGSGWSVSWDSETQITGHEGYAIVRVPGTHSSISFDYTSGENYANFMFGVAVEQNCDDFCVAGDCNPNTFLNTGDPNTIEYDNLISGFHSSIIKKEDGTYLVWGQNAKPGVIGEHLYEPTEITPENGFNYAGDILKATLGTRGENTDGTDQYAVLTTEGLYIWGGGSPVAANQNGLVHSSVKNTQTFDKMTSANIPNANEYGLPTGVNPTDVKMLFGSYATLAITTCTGEAWVLSYSGAKNGDGTPDDAANRNIWHRVMKDASTPLNGVVAIRGKQGALMALTANGEIYTWGTATYLGDGTSAQNRLFATQMTLPAGVTPKMIGMTSATVLATDNSYYLLSTSGEVYSLGTNNRKQLGTYDNVEQLSWVNVKSTDASTNLTNVVWISPNEHDRSGNAVVQALTAEGKLWGWGYNHANMLGAGASGTATDPRSMYGGLNSTDKILAVETGGHISTIFKDCDYKLGYIGHQINGSYANDNPESTSAVFQFDGAKFSDLCGIQLPPYPEVIDLEICEGLTADLADALQNTVPDGHTLEWWTTPNREAGTQVADPTEVEGGTYYAFFAGNCPDLTGEEVIVTENPLPVVPQDVANVKTFVNNDFEFTVTVSGGVTYIWEYATVEVPADTDWNVLDNDTYNGMIILDETTFRISHATQEINGLWVRLKAVSDMGCEAYSNEVFIEVADGMIITNPMLRNRARQ